MVKLNDRKTKDKFTEFMAIRNKFAHIRKIDSFNSYLELAPSFYNTKSQFKKWFTNFDFECENPEENYKNAFLNLTGELISELTNLRNMYLVPKIFKSGAIQGQKQLLDSIIDELNKSDSGKEILKKARAHSNTKENPPFPGIYEL